MTRRAAVLAALIVWIAVIFSFSLHSGASSHGQSQWAEQALRAVLHRAGIRADHRIYAVFRPFLLPGEMLDAGFFVRKAAHAGEYAVLGLLGAAAFRLTAGAWKRCAALLGPAVSLVDEKIIQRYLAQGRTATFHDVALDSLAFCLAFLLALGLSAALRAGRRRARRPSGGRTPPSAV